MEVNSTKPIGVGSEEEARSKKLKDLEMACRDFESIFLSMMLREMRRALHSDGLIPKGFAEEIFTDMFDDEISKRISEAEGIGLWKTLYENLRKSI